MGRVIEIAVPDIGDFRDVEIIDVLVEPGAHIAAEQPLITLESDKATMDVPSAHAGMVKKVNVSVGDKVSEGSSILALELAEGVGDEPAAAAETAPPAPAPPSPKPSTPVAGGSGDIHAEVLVLGAGPGGYTAAFRAADLGKKTVLVERYETLGGVCLNVGCIPSKAYLHAAEVISEVREMAAHGIDFGEPKLNPAKIVSWKDEVVHRLTRGLAGLARQRKVEVVQGTGAFASANTLTVETADGPMTISFDQAIIAAGSQASRIPPFPNDDPRLWNSTDALNLASIPERLLVIGGGIIGLEMATVFEALGSRVTVVELLDSLMPGCDKDLLRPLQKRITGRYENIFLKTRVTSVEAQKKGLKVTFEGKDAPGSDVFDNILVAVGRSPNGHRIGAEKAGVHVDEQGFIPVDRQQRTNVAHIFAIGDIVGHPMLAHKATHEGKIAAEVAVGLKSGFDAVAIPSVAYTDPEIAWAGLTEINAKAQGIDYDKGVFPWAASGRATG